MLWFTSLVSSVVFAFFLLLLGGVLIVIAIVSLLIIGIVVGGGGTNLSVRQLVLREVLTHFVQTIDCPQGQFRHLNPSIVHRFSVHDNHDQMQWVLLKACRQTRASSWSNTSLATVEAFTEEFVSVGPVKISYFILNVFALALIMRATNDFSEYWVLHHDARQSTDVRRSWLVIFVAQSVRIGVISWLETEGSGIPIQLLKEVFHRLVTLKTTLIFIKGASSSWVYTCCWVLWLGACVILGVGALLVIFEASSCFKQVLAKMLSERHRSIITRRKHEPV